MINFNFPTLNLKATGNRIHTLRVNSGYTVEDIAAYMGFAGPQAVYKWEWGKSLPTVDNLYALSKLFGVTIEKILVGNDESFLLYGKVVATKLQVYFQTNMKVLSLYCDSYGNDLTKDGGTNNDKDDISIC